MDLSTVMSIVQAILAVIKTSHQIRQFCFLFGYKSELDDLQTTLNTINAVFRDAEAKHDGLSHQEKQYIEELKDAVYDADDVLDEFFTLVQQKQLTGDGVTLSNKVKSFLSRLKPSTIKLSRKLKKVQTKLNGIATRSNQFSFKVDYTPIKFRREETCSYVYAGDIIGREADVENILGMLLDPNVDHDVSCLTIVGIGGLGKTALAQLVYNHERVQSAFSTRLWTCVSDENPNRLDTEATLRKILASATGCKDDNLTLDMVQRKLRAHLAQKRYLLVLDDVWNENPDDWMKLAGFLKGDEMGSRILVTTRSRHTTSIIGNGPMYELPGLSDEDSWRLFQRVAFRTERPDPSCVELVSIGREIVKKCASVPLAIRATGSLLYGQRKSKWLLFQEKGLANIAEGEHDIKHILKLSYHHLTSSLKSCFRYCAIFPKDSVMQKEELIRLWKAQGYIVPEEGEDIEDVAEQYFLILLRRCFFQDVEKDYYGEIILCKMHDLMHDIAQDAAGNEICIAGGPTINMNKKSRHLFIENIYRKFIGNAEFVKFSANQTNIRTCLCESHSRVALDELVEKCTRLRTLDLSGLDITSLPDSVGNLLHLRYLDVSHNRLEVIPKSITKLHNLQTLDLNSCWKLRELPKDVGKLVNLSFLEISHCFELKYMPVGLGNLTSLHTLSQFVVGRASTSGKQFIDELEILKPLNNLKGNLHLDIRVPNKDAEYFKKDDDINRGGSYMRSKDRLNFVSLSFEDRRSSENEEAVLELLLQPHPNLRKLRLNGYHGVRMATWLSQTHLPNLVTLGIQQCNELRWLPSVGRLPHLKHLKLKGLPEVEYVESKNPEETPGSSCGAASSYFPCLETLELVNLSKLKGWWGTPGSELVPSSSPFLPHLKQLYMEDCPEMRCIPWSPSLEELKVEVNYIYTDQVHLRVVKNHDHRITDSSFHPSSSALHSNFHPKPMQLTVNDSKWLKSLPTEYLLCVTYLEIEEDEGVDMGIPPEGMQYCTSLRSLKFRGSEMKSVPDWMPNLTTLTHLEFQWCSEQLKERCQKDIGEDWPLIQRIPNILFEVEDDETGLSDDEDN